MTKALAAISVEAPEDGYRIGRLHMRVVTDPSARSLLGFLRETVEPGTAVHIDGWPSHSQVEGLGYRHEVTVLRDPRVAGQLLLHVRRTASLFKSWWAGTHQRAVSGRHLDYYLDQFRFRFNPRGSRSRGKLFYRLVQHAVDIEPVSYRSVGEAGLVCVRLQRGAVSQCTENRESSDQNLWRLPESGKYRQYIESMPEINTHLRDSADPAGVCDEPLRLGWLGEVARTTATIWNCV